VLLSAILHHSRAAIFTAILNVPGILATGLAGHEDIRADQQDGSAEWGSGLAKQSPPKRDTKPDRPWTAQQARNLIMELGDRANVSLLQTPFLDKRPITRPLPVGPRWQGQQSSLTSMRHLPVLSMLGSVDHSVWRQRIDRYVFAVSAASSYATTLAMGGGKNAPAGIDE
jgi:hypothetical protein